MKRSKAVVLTLIPAVAAWFASCSRQPPLPTHQQICADQDNRIVDDDYCSDRRRGAYVDGRSYPHHWYWMPYRAGGYPIGMPMSGGSYVAPSGSGVRVGTGHVVTGGFGSTGNGLVTGA
jgi:hypothetical protein